jgi:hypothetical protein
MPLALTTRLIALSAASTLATSAFGTVSFSFADPANGMQLVNRATSATTSSLTSTPGFMVDFVIDGSSMASPFSTIVRAEVFVDFTIAQGASAGGIYQAPVSGNFRIVDAASGQLLIRGDAQQGTFLRIGGTSSAMFSDVLGFGYTKGQALESILAASGNPNTPVQNPQEAVFTLTRVAPTTGTSIINQSGRLNDFSANSSFSGNYAIPAPGAAALLGLSALAATRRKRR